MSEGLRDSAMGINGSESCSSDERDSIDAVLSVSIDCRKGYV